MDISETEDGDDCDNGDDGDDDEDGDDSDDEDGDDEDDGGDGICPIFPIRLQRLPDHRADGTTSLMIKHLLVQMLGAMLTMRMLLRTTTPLMTMMKMKEAELLLMHMTLS